MIYYNAIYLFRHQFYIAEYHQLSHRNATFRASVQGQRAEQMAVNTMTSNYLNLPKFSV
jgi:hypothetical protein